MEEALQSSQAVLHLPGPAPAGIGTVSQFAMVAAASSGQSLRQLWMKNTLVFYSVVPYANIIDNKVSRKISLAC